MSASNQAPTKGRRGGKKGREVSFTKEYPLTRRKNSVKEKRSKKCRQEKDDLLCQSVGEVLCLKRKRQTAKTQRLRKNSYTCNRGDRKVWKGGGASFRGRNGI